jgi:glycosyltransferase involved in cell wall biosynthesis
MIRVAALTSGKNTPSARFRVRQHIKSLLSCDIQVDEYIPLIERGSKVPLIPNSIKPRYVPPVYLPWLTALALTRLPGVIGSRGHQITWLQRELIAGLYTLERFLKSPIAFDVDDAIWLASIMGKRTSREIARRSAVVIAGNTFLAEWYSQYAREVEIVPTAIDPNRFFPGREKANSTFVIGWTGSHGNLPYLEAIEPPLHRFLVAHPSSILRVICNKKPNFHLLSSEHVEFIQWSDITEITSLQSMDVGLMPLDDSMWTRGKCSFKMLQYMSCQIPVIVSPVGMNNDVLAMGQVGFSARNHDEWYERLDYYYHNADVAINNGKIGRRIIEQNFSQEGVTKKLAKIFRTLV